MTRSSLHTQIPDFLNLYSSPGGRDGVRSGKIKIYSPPFKKLYVWWRRRNAHSHSTTYDCNRTHDWRRNQEGRHQDPGEGNDFSRPWALQREGSRAGEAGREEDPGNQLPCTLVPLPQLPASAQEWWGREEGEKKKNRNLGPHLKQSCSWEQV